MESTLCLLVIRSVDLPRAKAFYEALGLRFLEEQHGNGPQHLACELGNAVFEIYPREPTGPSTTSVRLGFRVAKVDEVLTVVGPAGGSVRMPAKDGPWGRRAVVSDPDGHVVELLQHT
jgi:predicted enzyme related to lactoylglutathione lyase